VALKIKIGRRKVKNASLAQQNSFGLTRLQNLMRLVKDIAKPNTCQRRVI
jgi:hypothetical protein